MPLLMPDTERTGLIGRGLRSERYLRLVTSDLDGLLASHWLVHGMTRWRESVLAAPANQNTRARAPPRSLPDPELVDVVFGDFGRAFVNRSPKPATRSRAAPAAASALCARAQVKATRELRRVSTLWWTLTSPSFRSSAAWALTQARTLRS